MANVDEVDKNFNIQHAVGGLVRAYPSHYMWVLLSNSLGVNTLLFPLVETTEYGDNMYKSCEISHMEINMNMEIYLHIELHSLTPRLSVATLRAWVLGYCGRIMQ